MIEDWDNLGWKQMFIVRPFIESNDLLIRQTATMGNLKCDVWEASSAIGVADSDVGSTKCDRGGRFYRGMRSRRRINA